MVHVQVTRRTDTINLCCAAEAGLLTQRQKYYTYLSCSAFSAFSALHCPTCGRILDSPPLYRCILNVEHFNSH